MINKIKKVISVTKSEKHNPIYDTCMYWSQKAFNINSLLIEAFTKRGDIIFDPFMGSGVTIIEAVSDKLSRKAIGSEINEAPIFMVNTILKKHNIDAIDKLRELCLELTKYSHTLYGTKCVECGNQTSVNTVVFDIVGLNKIIKILNYRCSNASCKCKSKEPDDFDYNMMDFEYELKNIENIELIYNSKIAVKENMHIFDIFTRRNLKALDIIIELKKTKYYCISDLIDYILLSMIHLCKITDTHSNSQWPLWIPKNNCVEKNVFNIFVRKVDKIEKYFEYMKNNYKKVKLVDSFEKLEKSNQYMIISKGTQKIDNSDIPDNSVDFILTDPPYMGQVLYSEYMQLYKPFLNFNFNLEDEIVVSSAPSRIKKENDYFKLLKDAFEICSKKIKNNHIMCLYFHDCNLNVWNKLINILYSVGFEYITQIHIDKTITLKNIISPKKSLNGDSVLFFIKKEGLEMFNKKQWSDDIEMIIYLEAKSMLSNGPLTTPELYDNGLMEIIIQNGWLEVLAKKYKTLVEIFEKYFIWESVTGRWKNK